MKLRSSRIEPWSESIAGVDPALGLGRGGAHHVRNVFERQRYGVEGLDDPVMQVAADAVTFLDDGQVGGLLVQLGIVDRDASMQANSSTSR